MNRKTQTSSGKDQEETMVTDSYHILLAEDDTEMRALLALSLRKIGYNVTECRDGVGLLTYLGAFLLPDKSEHEHVDLIISDIRMPGFTGMELLEGAPKNEGFPPMILITAFGDEETHVQAKEFGAAAMFDKPFDMDDLLAKVRELLPLKEKSRGQLKTKKDYNFKGADHGKKR